MLRTSKLHQVIGDTSNKFMAFLPLVGCIIFVTLMNTVAIA